MQGPHVSGYAKINETQILPSRGYHLGIPEWPCVLTPSHEDYLWRPFPNLIITLSLPHIYQVPGIKNKSVGSSSAQAKILTTLDKEDSATCYT